MRGWAHQEVRDSQGNVLETGMVYITPPDLYEKDGASHLGPYVEKLLVSKNWFSSVTGNTTDGLKAFQMIKMEGELQVDLTFDNPGDGEREKKARAFFAKLGIRPTEDYLASNGGVSDATRVLAWPVKGGAKELTRMLQTVSDELCGIPDFGPLEIKFEEHPDERGKHVGHDGIHVITSQSKVIPPDSK